MAACHLSCLDHTAYTYSRQRRQKNFVFEDTVFGTCSHLRWYQPSQPSHLIIKTPVTSGWRQWQKSSIDEVSRISTLLLVLLTGKSSKLFALKQFTRCCRISFWSQLHSCGLTPLHNAVAAAMENNPQSDEPFCFWVSAHWIDNLKVEECNMQHTCFRNISLVGRDNSPSPEYIES